MNIRLPTLRWAAWALALVLVLKAAVPLLASASASLQGKALAEVCTVYGVTTVVLDERESAPEPGHGSAAHGGEHCALSAVNGLTAPPASTLQGLVAPAPQRARPTRVSPPTLHAPDACATWVARLKHGPPTFA